jgi:hypothetical protein
MQFRFTTMSMNITVFWNMAQAHTDVPKEPAASLFTIKHLGSRFLHIPINNLLL